MNTPKSALAAGMRVTYYPAPKNQADNLHFPAVVEEVKGKRCRLRVFRDDAPPPDGRIVHVHAKSVVVDQVELLGEPVE